MAVLICCVLLNLILRFVGFSIGHCVGADNYSLSEYTFSKIGEICDFIFC